MIRILFSLEGVNDVSQAKLLRFWVAAFPEALGLSLACAFQ